MHRAVKARDEYVVAARALDRVLMSNFYCLGGIDGGRGGYWDRFRTPEDRANDDRLAYPLPVVDTAKDRALAAAKH